MRRDDRAAVERQPYRRTPKPETAGQARGTATCHTSGAYHPNAPQLPDDFSTPVQRPTLASDPGTLTASEIIELAWCDQTPLHRHPRPDGYDGRRGHQAHAQGDEAEHLSDVAGAGHGPGLIALFVKTLRKAPFKSMMIYAFDAH